MVERQIALPPALSSKIPKLLFYAIFILAPSEDLHEKMIGGASMEPQRHLRAPA